MSFFKTLWHKAFARKDVTELKPISKDVWWENQRIIAAEFEKHKYEPEYILPVISKKKILKKTKAISASKPKVKKRPKAKGKLRGHK